MSAPTTDQQAKTSAPKSTTHDESGERPTTAQPPPGRVVIVGRSELARSIRALFGLRAEGRTWGPGTDIRQVITRDVSRADALIVVITGPADEADAELTDLAAEAAFTAEPPTLVLPVVLRDAKITFPESIRFVTPLFVESDAAAAVRDIRRYLETALAKRTNTTQEQRLEVEASAAQHLDVAMGDLERRSSDAEASARIWYLFGWLVLAVGAAVAAYRLLHPSNELATASLFAQIAIGAVLAGFLLAMARYAFTMGRNYMAEAVKYAERRHAISFGRFFLQAFPTSVDAKSVREILSTWNINPGSSFERANADDYDPKLAEKALGTIEKLVEKIAERAR